MQKFNDPWILTMLESLFPLMETSTIGQLRSTSKVFFDTPREQFSKRVQVTDVQFVPAVSDGTLTVKAKTRTDNHSYDTSITFEKVKYVNEGRNYAVPFTAVDGQEYLIMPLRKMREYVKVRCTCMDFYWRFATWNHKNKSLMGAPPDPYIKKTNRPPVNPDKVPGACKHIMRLADEISKQQILK